MDMNRDIMDYPWVRRLVKTWVALMVLAVIFVFVWTTFVMPRLTASWEAEWVGRTESEVVANLGKPSYEGRDPVAPSKDFSLAWTERFGTSLRLEFKGGVVVKAGRSSR